MKTLVIGKTASDKAIEALDKVAVAVGSTLGPGGRPALIDKYEPAFRRIKTTSTKDGVTLLENLKFTDPVENAIHSLCHTASQHTVNIAGDGTTSTIVLAASLARAIIKQKSKTPQAYGRYLKREINKCIDAVDEFAFEKGEIDDLPFKLAMTSSNGDEEIASIVRDVVGSCSKYSNIVIDKNPSCQDRYSVNRCDGYASGNGFYRFRKVFTAVDPNANDTLHKVVVKNPAVLLWNGNVNKFDKLEEIAQKVLDPSTKWDNLVVIAFSIADSVAEEICTFNRKYKNKILVSEVKNSHAVAGFGFQVLLDTEAFTGSKIFDPIQEFTMDHIGTCGEIVFSGRETTVKYRAKNNTIKQRCKFVSELLNDASLTAYEKDVTNTRNSELAEGLVSIVVGGGQHAEIQERADRLDDAVRSAQSFKTGAVAGGGVIYSRIAEKVLKDENLKEALKGIVDQNIKNYGIEFDYLNDEKFNCKTFSLFLGEDDDYGFVDVSDCYVVDSATAVKSVLQQASTLAVLITTTGCMSLDGLLEEREKINLYSSLDK